VPLDAAARAVGRLLLGEDRQESRRRPAFLVGLGRDFRPDRLDARQAQLVEQQFESVNV
jgi:hypothetical protein